MSSIEGALTSRLVNFAGLSALVANRVGPHPAAQDRPYPFVTYQRKGGMLCQGLDGSHGLARPKFQVTVFSTRFEDTVDVGAQIALALVGFKGTVAGVVIKGISEAMQPIDMYDE